MRILGVVLLVLGLLALVYGGINYTTHETVLDLGPVHATVDRQNTVLIPPIAGGLAVAAGAALLVMGRRRT